MCKFVIVCSQIQCRNLALSDGITQAGHRLTLNLIFNIGYFVGAVCAKAFLQQALGIGDPEREGTKAAQTNDAELRITHHDGIGGSPFAIEELLGGHEIHICLEGAVKSVFPGLQCSQNRHVAGLKLIPAGTENIGQLSFVDENGNLALSDGELCTHHDFLAIHVILVNDRVAGRISPLDNINQLSFYKIKNAHLCLPPFFLNAIIHPDLQDSRDRVLFPQMQCADPFPGIP